MNHVEDFMVAGGMWRKMITSRHQRGREGEGRRIPPRTGSGRTLVQGGATDPLGFNGYLEMEDGCVGFSNWRRRFFEDIFGKNLNLVNSKQSKRYV